MPPKKKQPAARRLAEMIESVHSALVFEVSQELENHGFRLQSYCLLELIGKQTQAQSTKQIAEQTHQTKAAASDMIIRLEKRGYLVTRPAKDRRKVQIELTLKGVKFVEQIRDELASKVSWLMGTLNPSEQQSWLRISETVMESVNQPTLTLSPAPDSLTTKLKPKRRRGANRDELPPGLGSSRL